MTVFDFAVIGVILLSGYFAYSRGFVREALSIAAWINASFVAVYALPYVLPLFEKFLPKGVIASVSAAVVVFVLALMVLHMVSSRLAARVKENSAIAPVDRSFGLLFGLARGMIFVCLGYIALAWMLPPGKDRPRWFADARALPYLEAGAGKMRSFIPLPHGGATRTVTKDKEGPVSSAEKEAESAIKAFSRPGGASAPASNPAPAYTPAEQRDLNRLIQQQNAN